MRFKVGGVATTIVIFTGMKNWTPLRSIMSADMQSIVQVPFGHDIRSIAIAQEV